jgi:hypothetical protein
VAEDILDVLTRFHREVFLPDFEKVIEERISVQTSTFCLEMLSHFEEIHRRFDRLESLESDDRASVDGPSQQKMRAPFGARIRS